MPLHESRPSCAVVAIGMSAGALAPLRTILSALPRPLPAALVIAHHVGSTSLLPSLIQTWSKHDARFARANEPLVDGTILVCPPSHHLMVNPNGTLGLSGRARVAHVRPSVDWLFESLAASFGPRAIAVVLSGANADGARGARAVLKSRGRVLAQTPSTSDYPAMPLAAGIAGARWMNANAIAAALMKRIARVNAKPTERWDEPFGPVS